MNGGDACQGAPYGKELAAAGYRVLLFEFAGFGASTAAGATKPQQVAAAAAYLRSDGVADVALIGGSMGGTASLVAATQISPPVKAVVSLSAPSSFSGDDAVSAVAKLAVPVFYTAGEYESSFVGNAQEMFAATPATVAKKLVLGAATASHGLWLTDPTVGVAGLRAEIKTFLQQHAPV
ncbi:MAG: alpha/beta fold hydrolase [Hamadaea sp.]|nr:alpha/beta fold hydrolase [Hamadaea sp.]